MIKIKRVLWEILEDTLEKKKNTSRIKSRKPPWASAKEFIRIGIDPVKEWRDKWYNSNKVNNTWCWILGS